MSTHTMFHQPVKFEARIGGGFAYLSIEDDKGNIITVHMPAAQARAVADAFSAKVTP